MKKIKLLTSLISAPAMITIFPVVASCNTNKDPVVEPDFEIVSGKLCVLEFDTSYAGTIVVKCKEEISGTSVKDIKIIGKDSKQLTNFRCDAVTVIDDHQFIVHPIYAGTVSAFTFDIQGGLSFTLNGKAQTLSGITYKILGSQTEFTYIEQSEWLEKYTTALATYQKTIGKYKTTKFDENDVYTNNSFTVAKSEYNTKGNYVATLQIEGSFPHSLYLGGWSVDNMKNMFDNDIPKLHPNCIIRYYYYTDGGVDYIGYRVLTNTYTIGTERIFNNEGYCCYEFADYSDTSYTLLHPTYLTAI